MKRVERLSTWSESEFQRHNWESVWATWDQATMEAAVRWEGVLPIAMRAFRPGSLLLEAGCGTGKYCLALQGRGYRMIGVDFARSGLELLRTVAPSMPAAVGAVTRLPFADGAFDGALSLGVVEHFEEGPNQAIQELARVIRPGGSLLLTVPFHHLLGEVGDYLRASLRRGRSPLGEAEPGRSVFYQYLFRRREMAVHLERAGFRVREVRYLAKQLGLSESLRPAPAGMPPAARAAAAGPASRAGLKSLVKRRAPELAYALRGLQLSLVESFLPGSLCAHTIAFVATRLAPA